MGGSGVEFRHYFRAVVKRLWMVLLLAAVIAVGVYWRTTSQPPKYNAKTRIILTSSSLLTAPASSTSLGSGSTSSSSSSGTRNDTSTKTANTVIVSGSVAERVAREVGLKDAKAVRKMITSETVSGTNMIDITATSSDRELSAKVANGTARHFAAFFADINRRNYRDIRLFLGAELAKARAGLEASDLEIQRIKERNAFVDLSSAISQTEDELADIRADIQDTRLRLKEDEAKLAAATARLSTENINRVYSTEIEDNPVYEQLRDRLTALEVERAELSQRYTARHPKMIQIEASVSALKQELATHSKTVVGRLVNSTNPVYDQLLSEAVTLQVDRAAAIARLAGLATTLRAKQSTLAALPAVERGLNALVVENEVLKENYKLLAEQHQEAVIRENEAGYVPAGVQVVEPAVTPAAPVSANLPLRTGIGALVGLLLGVVAAVVMESSDDKIRSAQDAERTLGAPVLAQVPDMAPQRVAPGGTVFLIALLLTVMLGGALVASRATTEATTHSGTLSVMVRLGRGLDGLTARVSQAIR